MDSELEPTSSEKDLGNWLFIETQESFEKNKECLLPVMEELRQMGYQVDLVIFSKIGMN